MHVQAATYSRESRHESHMRADRTSETSMTSRRDRRDRRDKTDERRLTVHDDSQGGGAFPDRSVTGRE